MTIASTTGAMTLSSTTATLTVSSTNGAMTIGPTGTGTLTVKTNSGAMSVQTTSGSLSVSSGDVLNLDAGSGKAHVFRKGTTEFARFNTSGMLQLNDSGTQNTHRFYVNGDSAFNGKISFGAQASNTITEKAYMQYNSTDNSIEFIFA